jgi:two-component system, sensor histidine kinase and response regulator
MPRKNKIKVLCVEDEEVVVEYISSLLDRNWYSIESITDGQEALDFLLTTENPPDILLLDYVLPSLDGIEILKKLKAAGKEYAVLFLSAVNSPETAVEAMKQGALDYLTKNKNLKLELNIKVEKAYKLHQERLQREYYEQQLALLSLATEQSPNSIVITDTEGNIEYVNKVFTKYTGYELNEVKGKNPRILKSDQTPPEYYKELWATISSGVTWKGEFINRKKNGELFYEKATISPIMNKAGKIVSYLGIKEDITELKKAEQALNKKTEEMDHFFSVGLDLLCIIEDGRFKRLNQAWEHTLGYTIKELLDHTYFDFVHPDDIESTRKAEKQLQTSGRLRNFVNRCRCKNGSYKFIEWSSLLNKDKTTYSFARDITERKLNERALQDSEARFRSIFETANAGIVFTDKDGGTVMVNEVFRSMLEYSVEELKNINFIQLTHQDDLLQTYDLHKELIANKINHYRIEKRYISKTGKMIWVDLAVSAIRDEHKELQYLIGVITDISGRKYYEQQLEEINSTKDKFFYIIAHDLRNQFSAIKGISELLMMKKSNLNEADSDKFISLLHNAGHSALNLLENLLEWSRTQINKVELVPVELNLHELVEDVLMAVDNQAILKDIKIFAEIDENIIIRADKHMISTVLRNLLNNAIKFTSSQGQITISASFGKDKHIISVMDNGVGISKKMLDKLFKIDSDRTTIGTAKEKGTGLGLILCKEFIDRHNGDISVKSEQGKGSEFIISLPVS